MKAVGQHVLQEAPDTFLGWESHGVPTMGPGVLRANTHVAIVEGEHPVVREGDTVDIPAPVAKHSFRALHARLAIDDPRGSPDRRGDGQIRALLTHQGAAAAPEELRKRLDGHEGRRTSGSPFGPISRDPTGRDQAVDVRMVDQGPGPGMQHTQDPHQTAHVMRVRGELHAGLRGGPQEDVVQRVLVWTDQRPQLLRPSKDDVEGGDRQEFLPSFL